MAIVDAPASITADDSWTDSAVLHGQFMVRVRGTFVATWTLQRSDDAGVTWDDVDNGTAATIMRGVEAESGILYRLGVKSGDYTSGTLEVRLSQ